MTAAPVITRFEDLYDVPAGDGVWAREGGVLVWKSEGLLETPSGAQTKADAAAAAAEAASISKSLVTTKGDLVVGTGAGTVARLGAGPNGDLLVADSTQADGLKWATLPSALGGSQTAIAYRLTSDGTTVTAYDATGAVVASSTDGGAVFTAILALIPTTGGHIEFRNEGHIFPWNTIPALPRALTRNLKIRGNWSTVQLSSSAPRMFDWGKVADYDTFQHIDIGEFTVDRNNIGGKNHTVVGPWQAGTWQRKINLDDVHVHDIRIVNAPVGTDSNTDLVIGVHIGGAASIASDTLCSFTNCSVKRIWSDGCLQLVAIHGVPVAAELTANTYHDRIVVDEIDHEIASTPTAANAGAHVMAGTKGTGGSITISRVRGKNSPDVGIECDGFQNATITDFDIEDSYDAPIYHVNYAQPGDPESQLLSIPTGTVRRRSLNDHGQGFVATYCQPKSVTGDNATDVFTSAAHGLANGDDVFFSALTGGTGLATCTRYFVIAATTNTFQLSTTSGGGAINFTTDVTAATLYANKNRPGSVAFGEGVKYHRLSTSAGFSVPGNGIGGDAYDLWGCRRITGTVKAIIELPTYSGASHVSPSAILIRGSELSNRTDVRLRMLVKVTGANSGSGTVDWRSLILRNGNLTNFDLDLESDVTITTDGNATLINVDVGSVSPNPSTLSGRLNVVIPIGSQGNTPVGTQFESGAAGVNSIPDEILYSGNHIGLASTSTDINFTGATTLRSKVRIRDLVWRIFPRPSAVMSGQNFASSTFTTATGNQYVGGTAAEIHFATGTGAGITKIEVSKDGTTYEEVYVQASGAMAQDVLIPVDHGDFVRVTFATTQPTTRVRFRK